MQAAGTMNPRVDTILEWLEQEMGYRLAPSSEALNKVCRGNMLPVWKYLLERVRSEKTADKIKRNIHVHGNNASLSGKEGTADEKLDDDFSKATERDRRRSEVKLKSSTSSRNVKLKEAREKESATAERGTEAGDQREKALQEREEVEKEVARLRHQIERSLKDLRGRMSDLSTEEAERQRNLDEKSNSRHKQVLLEAYNQRCEQAILIYTEYWRRLHSYVEQARESQRGGWSNGGNERFNKEPSMFATAVPGETLSDDSIFIETGEERSIRVSCELISRSYIDIIRGVVQAYDGDAVRNENQNGEAKLGFVVDGGGGFPEQVKETALSLLSRPPHLLQGLINYTVRIVNNISKETEKIDIRADAERLRYKYENDRITEDGNHLKEANHVAAVQQTVQEKNKGRLDSTNRIMFKQLRERQTAHVQQFMATEDMLNLASEATSSIDEIVKSLCGGESAYANGHLSTGGLKQIQLDVWGKERELAGLKASVERLTSEVQRLRMMCEERKQAKEDLRRKWKKIEEFSARRMELESVYGALLHANRAAATSWEQYMTAARELSNTTLVPVCTTLQNDVNNASDLIEREVGAFIRSPDNRLYLIPAFTQGLLDAVGASNAAGPEAVAAVHRNADLLTARAAAGDPSAVASINRIKAALQNLSGAAGEGADSGLLAVVDSLQSFFQHKVSSASLLEDLARAVNQMQLLRELVSSGRMLLAASNSSRPEYERNAAACAAKAAEQENIALEQWLPELKAAVQEAQKCLEYSKHVRGLVDEWWEQPASTAVDWITVDGQNVAAWLAHVKQLQVAFYEKQLL